MDEKALFEKIDILIHNIGIGVISVLGYIVKISFFK
jgi:hypothetical protein